MNIGSSASKVLSCFVIILTVIFLPVISVNAQVNQKNILILNSYHKGFPWTDNIVAGIDSVLKSEESNINLFVEYMDTKSNAFTEDYKQVLYELYRHKYRDKIFDVILSSDDNALEFVRDYHQELFYGAPVVFCGVNNRNVPNVVDPSLFTGVLESTAHEETIDLILDLHPQTKKIYLVIDRTSSGNYRWDVTSPSFSRYQDVEFIRLSDEYTIEEIESIVGSLGDESAIIFFALYRDRSGKYLSVKEGATKITRASARPVYTTHLLELPYGVVGGKVLGGFHHGQFTAGLAQRILNGEPVSSISVVKKSPTKYVFNYDQLEKWNIDLSSLPEGSTVLNRPVSLYEENKALVWSVLTVIFTLIGIIFVLQINIMSRKRAVAEAIKSRAEFEAIFNSISEGIIFVDRQRKIIRVNRAFSKMFGYQIEEVAGKSTEIIYADPKSYLKLGQDRFNPDAQIDNPIFENVYRRKDGTTFPGETIGDHVIDESGELLGYIGVILDVTKRRKTENALRKSNQDLHLAQRIAAIGNWTLDPEVGVPEWTDEVYRIYERNPELGPYSLAEYKNIYKGEWFEKFTSAIQSAVHEGQPYDIELKLELAPDNVKWVNAICEPEQKPGLKGYYLRGTIQDITERKQVEQERQELESQLRQKYKMEAVGVMAGGMAHNFNNNLAIILGNLDLSKGKLPAQSEIGEFLDYAKIAAVRARDLVKQIMTYSRKETQSRTPMHLSLLLKETISLLKATVPSSVNLQQDINPGCENAYIQADASQIQECLLNLCNNAVHAMEEQGVLLLRLDRGQLKEEDIPVRFHCAPGDYLCLSIQDNGCGIPAEIQEKIFDPFFTTKELYEGTGMGLSTVLGIVEQHLGMITIESAVGEGTTFHLYFPVVDQLEKEAVADKEVELQRGSERILYVDDDQMVANLNERMLSELGYQVTVMTGSVKALEHFSANVDSYDLVMTDQTMPELTGIELIQNIKKLRPELPTILCTGYSSKVDGEEALQLGISAFLMKPVGFPELSAVIRSVLEKSKAQ